VPSKRSRNAANQREEAFLDQDQLECLASGPRHEVFGTLLRLGPASVREVAEALGQPADALYFHIRRLLEVGLIENLGKRAATTRREKVYRVVSARLRSHPTTRDAGYLAALGRLFESLSRGLARRLKAALEVPALERQGPDRELTVRSLLVRLDGEALREVNRRLDELSEFLAEQARVDEGEPYQVFLAAARLPERRSGRGRSETR
jgi:DNA-binding transcriptional ArsR family regulator